MAKPDEVDTPETEPEGDIEAEREQILKEIEEETHRLNMEAIADDPFYAAMDIPQVDPDELADEWLVEQAPSSHIVTPSSSYYSCFLTALGEHNKKWTKWDTNSLMSLGLVALSAATDRNLRVEHTWGKEYPSVVVLLIGAAGRTNKSSQLTLLEDLIEGTMPGYILPRDITLAALEEVLADRAELDDKSSGLWYLDECTSIFEKRDFNVGLDQFFNLMYDCKDNPPATKRVSKRDEEGNLIINERKLKNVFVPCAMATQPKLVEQIYTSKRIHSGFVRRILPVYVKDSQQAPTQFNPPPDQREGLTKLVATLKVINETLRQHPCKFIVPQEAADEYNLRKKNVFDMMIQKENTGEYTADEMNVYSGLSVYALRMAMLLEVSKVDKLLKEAPSGHLTLSKESVEFAWSVVMGIFYNGMKRALFESGPWERFIHIVREEPGVSRMDVYRHLNIRGEELERLLRHPIVRDRVVVKKERPDGGIGRSVQRFYPK